MSGSHAHTPTTTPEFHIFTRQVAEATQVPLGPRMGGRRLGTVFGNCLRRKRYFSMGCKLWIKNNKNAKEKLTTDFIHLALE